MYLTRKTKGVTLIALAITIVISLIVAGITIATITGDGTFGDAQIAKKQTEKESLVKIVETAYSQMDIYSVSNDYGVITIDNLMNKITDISDIDSDDYFIEKSTNTASIINKETGAGVEIFIESDGTVRADGIILDDLNNMSKPKVTYTVSPETYTADTEVTITVIAEDQTNGIKKIQFEGKEPENIEGFETTVEREYKVVKKGTYGFIAEGNNGRITRIEIDLPYTATIPNSTTLIDAICDPTTATNGKVKVTLVNKSTDSNLTLKYSIGSSTGQYVVYDKPFEMEENETIFARLFNNAEQYSGMKEIKISNIDKVAPATFNISEAISPNTYSIKVSGSTSDLGSPKEDAQYIKIRGYKYRIIDSDENVYWSEETPNNSYTFTTGSVNGLKIEQGKTYKVNMKAIDLAGNETMANAEKTVIMGNVVDSALATNISVKCEPEGPTKESVKVTFENKTGNTDLKLKYQIGSTTGTWLDYTEPVSMSTNGNVYARLYDSLNQYKNEAKATVDNIDKVAPKAFNLSTSKTTNSITVTGSTTDEYTAGCAEENYGISEYKFILKNSKGEEIKSVLTKPEETSYTFTNLTQDTTYLVSVIAKDKVGNSTEATNKNTSVTTLVVADSKEKIGISYSITTPTNKDVIVTFTDNSGISGLTLKYQIGSTTGTWLNYPKEGVTVSTNTVIYARLFDSTGQSSNTTATATVANIDKVEPAVFVTTENSGADGIMVTAEAVDNELGMATTPTYNYYLNGTLKKSTTESTYVITGATASSSNVVKVTVTDAATNLGTKEVTVSNLKHTSHTVDCYFGEIHQHSGNTTTGGECYTEKYHVHNDSCKNTGTYVFDSLVPGGTFNPNTGGFPSYYKCDNCGHQVYVDGAWYGSNVHNCGEGYSCGKTTSTIESYILDCGKEEGKYYSPVKHTHVGNSTSGGECYTAIDNHTHTDSCYGKKEGRMVTTMIIGRNAYRTCNLCGATDTTYAGDENRVGEVWEVHCTVNDELICGKLEYTGTDYHTHESSCYDIKEGRMVTTMIIGRNAYRTCNLCGTTDTTYAGDENRVGEVWEVHCTVNNGLICGKSESLYTLSCGKIDGAYYVLTGHIHSGNENSGDGCYQEPIYHTHDDCTKITGTYVFDSLVPGGSYNPTTGGFPSYYKCDNCGNQVYVDGAWYGSNVHNCGGYSCGKTTSTVELYTLSCGKTEGSGAVRVYERCNNIVTKIEPVVATQNVDRRKIDFNIKVTYLDGTTKIMAPTSTDYSSTKAYNKEKVTLKYEGNITKAGTTGTLTTTMTLTTK